MVKKPMKRLVATIMIGALLLAFTPVISFADTGTSIPKDFKAGYFNGYLPLSTPMITANPPAC